MNSHDFEALFHDTVNRAENLLVVKGGEYAGTADRLANFKRGSGRVGVHPLQILWIYAAKHIDSIETYIREVSADRVPKLSEPIEGRFDDLINYCILAQAIVRDLGLPGGPASGPIPPMVAGRDNQQHGGGVHRELAADHVRPAEAVPEHRADPRPSDRDGHPVHRVELDPRLRDEAVVQRTAPVAGTVILNGHHE